MPKPPQNMRWLTPLEEEIIRTHIAGGATRDEAASAAGVSTSVMTCRLCDQLKDLRTGQGRRGLPRQDVPDPTPEQIAERAASIRAGWTELEWSLRRVGIFNGPVDD